MTHQDHRCARWDERGRLDGLGKQVAVKIGQRGASDDFWDGAIDEVEIFSRALTPEEIPASFQAGRAGNRPTPLPNIVSRWPAEGDATDSAGASGLPTKITRANGAVTTMTYDERGNLLTSSKEAISATTTFTCEPAFNQVSSITDPKGNLTTISYGTTGNPLEITDALGNQTQMSYETRGLLTSVTAAAGMGTSRLNRSRFQVRGSAFGVSGVI